MNTSFVRGLRTRLRPRPPLGEPPAAERPPRSDTARASVDTAATTTPVLRLWGDAGDERVPALPPDREIPVWRGRVRPHLGGPRELTAATGWWWLGVHGGAGATTLGTWVSGGADAQRRWPDPACGGPAVILLVCRTHGWGLARARDAARQWAARGVPAGLLLGGAVAVADAPGRLSRPQAEALRQLAGVVPRVWAVPWVEQLRAAADARAVGVLGVPPAARRLAADLDVLRRTVGQDGPDGTRAPGGAAAPTARVNR